MRLCPAKSAEKTASGGKKFVQTRLPFKLITPGGGAGPTSSSSSSSSPATTGSGPVTVILDEDDPAPRKRKLSYDDESPSEGTGCSTGQLRRSTSKENLNLASSIATKKVKTTDSIADDVIELDEDEADKEMVSQDEVVEAKSSKVVKTKPKKAEAKKGSPAPIQIKLPLVNKRSKRRKSLKKSEEPLETSTTDVAKGDSESSDDIEIIAEELNPQKRHKVQTPREKSPENSSASGKQMEEEVRQKNGKDPKKQEESKKTGKESKKEEPKNAELNKKNDQATIDLFMGKKVETNKKDKPEVKTTAKDNKDPSIAEDSKPKEVPKKDTSKTVGKGKKEGAKPSEKSHHRVSVALEGHQRILEWHTRGVQLLGHQSPAHCVRIQGVHIDGLIVAIIVSSAVPTKAVDEVAHAHRCVIDPLWPAVQVHRPQHVLANWMSCALWAAGRIAPVCCARRRRSLIWAQAARAAEAAKTHKGKQVRRSCRSFWARGGEVRAQLRAIEGHTGVNADTKH
ncbi:GD16105 [Drosophila simulans]|uniref:GD16105 n=1 Tax=Drosophila simulans TaxID=7240 RepID=B4R6K2_DROSI|nr:GD16105 [Drosophila simulans]